MADSPAKLLDQEAGRSEEAEIRARATGPIVAFPHAGTLGYLLSLVFAAGTFAVGYYVGEEKHIKVLNNALFGAAGLLMLIAIMPIGMPWALGVKPLMLEKLPQDSDSVNQLTLLHYTFAVQNLTTACWLGFLAFFACGVESGSAVLAYFVVAAMWGCFNMYGKHSDKVGLDRRLMPIQMGLLLLFAGAITVGLLFETGIVDKSALESFSTGGDEPAAAAPESAPAAAPAAAAPVETAPDEGEARRMLGEKMSVGHAYREMYEPMYFIYSMGAFIASFALFAVFGTVDFVKGLFPNKPPPNEYVKEQMYVYVRATGLEMLFQQIFTLVGLFYGGDTEFVALFAGTQWAVLTINFVVYVAKSNLYGLEPATLAPFIAVFAFAWGNLVPYACTTIFSSL